MTASASNMNKSDPEAWLVDPHEKTFHVMDNKSMFEKHKAHDSKHIFI